MLSVSTKYCRLVIGGKGSTGWVRCTAGGSHRGKESDDVGDCGNDDGGICEEDDDAEEDDDVEAGVADASRL